MAGTIHMGRHWFNTHAGICASTHASVHTSAHLVTVIVLESLILGRTTVYFSFQFAFASCGSSSFNVVDA